MNEGQLTVVEPRQDLVLSGTEDFKTAVAAQAQLNGFIATQMKEGVDYGVIPGTKKKSLYKPGAEKLLFFNGLGCKLEPAPGTVTDWKANFFNYEYKAIIFHKRTGTVIAELYGSANSGEDRYAFQWLSKNRVPRGMDLETLPQDERSGEKGSWTVYRVDNPNPRNLVNTLQKMAQKRAMLGATLMACRASENFTTQAPEDVEPEDLKPTQPAPQEHKAAPPAGSSSDAISDPQRKRLWAIAKGAGVDESKLKAYVREKYPYTVDEEGACSLSLIKRSDYNAIVEWSEAQKHG